MSALKFDTPQEILDSYKCLMQEAVVAKKVRESYGDLPISPEQFAGLKVATNAVVHPGCLVRVTFTDLRQSEKNDSNHRLGSQEQEPFRLGEDREESPAASSYDPRTDKR